MAYALWCRDIASGTAEARDLIDRAIAGQPVTPDASGEPRRTVTPALIAALQTEDEKLR